jgi:signal transduction histidine kinase
MADLIHDIRTPLVAVRGYAKMMLEERAGSVNPTQREYLGIVVENTNRTVQLLKDLAHLATEPPLSFESIGVRDLWQDASKLWRSRAQAKAIQIQEKIPSESLAIRGNRHMLKQVFEVLLSNAVRSAEPGGEIAVEFSGRGGEAIEVRISDAGTGVIVEPAGALSGQSEAAEAQPGNPEEREADFSLVRDIIRLHGGQISVAGEGRGGSTLIFTLPV